MSTERTPHAWSNSDAYEAFMGRWSRVAADAALDWLTPTPGLRWVEVGCGTGALTEAIVAKTNPAEVLAVDPSPAFLAQARSRLRDERVTFDIGTAEELPATSNEYDIAIAGLALHFMSDPHQGVLEMTRCTHSGGTVTGYIWDIASDQQFMTPFWHAAKSLDPAAKAWDPLYRQQVNSAERVAALFTNDMLAQVTSTTLDFPIVFRDFADYWEPCLLNGSPPVQRYVQTLSDEERDVLRERLRAELPVAADGSIPLRGRLWITRATKSA